MDIKRKRIRTLVDVWSEIVRNNLSDRDSVIEVLKQVYTESSVEPIRGASNPPDLYDKEMISLYIIGKWGLGMDKELPHEFFQKVFWKELLIERAIDLLKKVSAYEELCNADKELCDALDDALVARILRFAFTMSYFGFSDEKEFRELLIKMYKIMPRFSETIRRFARFYIAYKIGEKIERGEVKNKVDLGIAKNLLALELSIPKAVPSNSYVVEVAKYFFTIPKRLADELKRE